MKPGETKESQASSPAALFAIRWAGAGAEAGPAAGRGEGPVGSRLVLPRAGALLPPAGGREALGKRRSVRGSSWVS